MIQEQLLELSSIIYLCSIFSTMDFFFHQEGNCGVLVRSERLPVA